MVGKYQVGPKLSSDRDGGVHDGQGNINWETATELG
jgi:hypothetical protein